MMKSSSTTTTRRSSAPSGRRRGRSAGNNNKNKNNQHQQQPVIDLTSFGFTSKKQKKRPAVPIVVDASASSDEVEVVESPAKRARRRPATTTAATTRTRSGRAAKRMIGSGKENGAATATATAKGTTATAAAASSSFFSATPAKKSITSSTDDKQKQALSSSSSRVALLDLTQDSSGSSSDNDIKSTVRKEPPESLALGGFGKTNTNNAAAKRRATTSLSGMADAMASKIISTRSSSSSVASASRKQQQQQQPGQQQQQRRGKRDRQQQRLGLKREGSVDAPIAIFDEDVEATDEKKKKRATSTENKNSQASEAPACKRGKSPVKLKSPTKGTNPGKKTPTKARSKSPVKLKSPSKRMSPSNGNGQNNVHQKKQHQQLKLVRGDSLNGRKSGKKTSGKARSMSPVKLKGPPEGIEGNQKSAAKRALSPQQQKVPQNSPQQKKQQQLVRGGSIQSYFSPAPKSASLTVKTVRKERAAAAVNDNASLKTVAVRTKSSKKVRANALGFMRVVTPFDLHCQPAVRQAQEYHFNANNNAVDVTTTTANDSEFQPVKIYPGAVVGRPRLTRNNRANFVDLGIAHDALGISRKHLKIMRVQGLADANSSTSPETTQESQLSQASVATTTSTSNEAPEILIQVLEGAKMVHIYRTREGTRKFIQLLPGQSKLLKVGDAVKFFSDPYYYFCVVGLVFAPDSQDQVSAVIADENGGVDANAARVLDFTPPPQENKKARPIARASGYVTARKKQQKISRAKMNDEDDVMDVIDVSEKKKAAQMDTIETIEIDGADNDCDMAAVDMTQPLSARAYDDGQSKLSPGSAVVVAKGATMSAMAMLSRKSTPLSGRSGSTTMRSSSPSRRNKMFGSKLDLPAFKQQQQMPDLDATMEPAAEGSAEDLRVELIAAQNESVVVANEKCKTPALTEKSEARKDEPQCDDPAAVSKKVVCDPIKKGDDVKVLFEVKDMFGDYQKEWYFGTVVGVKANSNSPTSCTIRVQYLDDKHFDNFQYPSDDIKKLAHPTDCPDFFPETFCVGDIVDAKYQDGNCQCKGLWHRGRVANVSDDGSSCDVMYYDEDYELRIPARQKKIRLIQRCADKDSMGESWLVGKSAMLKSVDNGSCYRTGKVSKKLGSGDYEVIFEDESSSEMVTLAEATKAVLTYLKKHLSEHRQHVFPSNSLVDSVRLRSQLRKQNKALDESTKKPKVKSEPKQPVRSSGRMPSLRSARSNNVVKEEPIGTIDELDDAWLSEHDDFDKEPCLKLEGGPALDPSVLGNRKTAKDFPPGLPNVLWCAFNSPEAQTGANFLQDMLCVHDSVPPLTMIHKLIDLMKYGPKAEGSSVHFKDSHRTELAAQYVYSLVEASSRLVKRDESALFGPSSWDDIEVLFSQSIVQTENMISGRRLAQGLQLAARGARLLSLMFTTELQGYDLYSTSSVDLDSAALKAMPTVRLVKSYGVRSGLKAAVRYVTKCLVRHSRWVLDQGGRDTSYNTSNECCALEAKACLDNLGSALCVAAWLFCVEERVDLADPACAFVIKDEFLVELERSLDELPEMNERNKKKFVKRLKMRFLLALGEDFATPVVSTLGKMIGLEDELALVGLGA